MSKAESLFRLAVAMRAADRRRAEYLCRQAMKLRDARGNGGPGKRPRPGSAPQPAVPPHGPVPLAGGAAAPLEFD